MPKPFLTLLLLLATTCAATAQTVVRQALPLRAVTLYLDGADLHHEGSLSLPAGAVDVRLTGLSPRLNRRSVQATASGATLEGVEAVAAPPVATDTLLRLRREEATLLAQKEFLTQNARLANPAPGHWLEEMQRSEAYYGKRVSQVAERLTQVQAQLQKRAAALPATVPTDLLLHLTVPRAAAVRLSLSYQVHSQDSTSTYTAWQPRYELRVREDDLHHVQAVSRATLYNGTGLAWAQVPVTLRTTTPAASLERPSLDPWTVDYGAATSEGEGRLANFAVKGPGTAGTASAPTDAPDLGASLRLPLPVTLAPAATQTFKLGEYTLPMRLEYLAVPKVEEDVFLVGRVADWNQVNFLAETATVFYRGAYVGETTLDTHAYSDTLEVALGRDPQVQLTRTKRVDFAHTSLGHETTQLAYEINVKNTHTYPVRLRLLDQVPVSQDNSIEVKVGDVGGAALEESSGKLTWLFGLAAGASRKFPVAFTVEARAHRRLNLRLNRRIKSPKFR